MSEEQKPLTREDVLKRIKERGGPYELNLSCMTFKAAIDLTGVELVGIILENTRFAVHFERRGVSDINRGAQLENANLSLANLMGAELRFANLQAADLIGANLQKATLLHANLQKADLSGANLQEADLRGAKLAKAKLYGAKISRETSLEDVDWGTDYILGDEQEVEQEKDEYKKREQLRQAESAYRNLKQWHTQAGMYDLAGEFYYREMEAKRKATLWWTGPKRWKQWKDPLWRRKLLRWEEPLKRLQLEIYRLLCGYGERPLNIVISAFVVVFGIAVGIYAASALTFPSSLYHSVVSFTALGYGLGVSNVDGWVKALGAAEAFMGVFMMALFLITFVRKMTR